MIRYVALLALLMSTAAVANGDELAPVDAASIVGKPYSGTGLPSEIEFINTRRDPVRLEWIAFDGTAKLYASIQPGGEFRQPTFVSHRWLLTPDGGDAPIEAFISTRSTIHGDGQPQLAIVR